MTPDQMRADLMRRQLAARQANVLMGGQPQTAPAGGSATNSQAVSEFGSKLEALGAGGLSGLTFGFADEGRGVLGGVGSAMRGEGFAPGYDATRDKVREYMAGQQAQEPGAFMGGNIAGAAIPALAAAPLATGASALGTVVRGGMIGGAEGALHGAGNADGQDVARQAMQGGVIGGGIGAAAPFLVGAIGMGGRALRGGVDNVLGTANQRTANRAIANTARRSRRTQDQIQDMLTRAARDGQPEFRVMDAMGVAGQRQVSGLTRAGGDTATEIAEFLERRQLGQGDRVSSFVNDAFGFRGTQVAPGNDLLPPGATVADRPADVLSRPQSSAEGLRGNLEAARETAANAAYGAARATAGPVDTRGVIDMLDERLQYTSGGTFARDATDDSFQKWRDRMVGKIGDDDAFLSDYDRLLKLKQAMQGEVGSSTDRYLAGQIAGIRNELDKALEAASPAHRAANAGYRDASGVIDSIDVGRDMSKPKRRAADTVPEFTALSPDQQAAARIGYGDDMLAKLENVSAPTSNRAKPLQSLKRDPEAAAMATDYPLYSDRLARENDMWRTQDRALGGSRTADNQTDQSAVSDLAGGVLDAARSAGNFNLGDMAAKVGNILGPVLKGQNEATRQLIARALMSDDPARVLGPALGQENTAALIRRMIEGVARQPAREGSVE